MPKKVKGKVKVNNDEKQTPLQPITVFAPPFANSDTTLKVLEVHAAEDHFNSLGENADNLDYHIIKIFFEKYKLSEEYIEINKEIETIRHQTRSNPKFKELFDNAFDLNDQDTQKMAIALEIASLLVDLKAGEFSFQFETLQAIFVLMSAFLPYYSHDIRSSWNLNRLLKSCEKMHGIYFHSLHQIVSIDIDFPLFKQMQSIYLCAMMMWIIDTDAEINLQYKLIKLAFSVLENCNHFNKLLTEAYKFDPYHISLILPSPLSIIDTIYTYYKKLDKNHTELSGLINLKEKLSNLVGKPFLSGGELFLRVPLLEELIFFLNKILNFGLFSTASINEKTYLFDKYTSYKEIVEKALQSYTPFMDKEYLITKYKNILFDSNRDRQKLQKTTKERILKKYKDKLNTSENEDLNKQLEILIANLTEENILDSIKKFERLYQNENIDEDIIEIFVDKESTLLVWKTVQGLSNKYKKLQSSINKYTKRSAQFFSELIAEDERKKIKETQELEANLAGFLEQKTKRADQEFTEKQLKRIEQEHNSKIREAKRAKKPKLSVLEQAQQKISLLLDIESPEEKESRMIDTIYELLGSKNLGTECIRETMLPTLMQTHNTHNIYPLLLLHINLFEHFTIEIEKNLRIYQKEYGSTIAIMKDKYRLDENNQLIPFSAIDRHNNSFINRSLFKISMLLNNMLSYFKKSKDILEVIKDLKNVIYDEPSFKSLRDVEIFIKDVYDYEKIPMELASLINILEEYKTNKHSIRKFLPSNPNKDMAKKNKEKDAYKQIDQLITDFQAIKMHIEEFNQTALTACSKQTDFIIQMKEEEEEEEVTAHLSNMCNLSLKPSTSTQEVKASSCSFFNQEKSKENFELKNMLLAKLYQLGEEHICLKKKIILEINNDQDIDNEKFKRLSNLIDNTQTPSKKV